MIYSPGFMSATIFNHLALDECLEEKELMRTECSKIWSNIVYLWSRVARSQNQTGPNAQASKAYAQEYAQAYEQACPVD